MRRIFISASLILALLFVVAPDRAKQSPNADSKRQDPAQQPAPPQPPPPQEGTPQRQDQGRIVQTVNLVDVLFTVLNRRNKLVPDLEKDAFKAGAKKAPKPTRFL